MSEHVVHIGIIEDSVSLMPYLKNIPENFTRAVEKHLGFARLGSITVAWDSFSFRLLEQYKPLWKNKDDLLEAKLSFVVGWISHRACDRQMKPIWNVSEMMSRGSDADPSVSPTEISVYHEATLYNIFYSGNPVFRNAIFPDQLASWTGAELVNIPLLSEFIESSFGMNMINIQTFKAPPENTDQDFMERVCLNAQKFYVDVNRYTRAAKSPVPENKKNFVKDIDWFNQDDEIIKVIWQIRQGFDPGAERVQKAIAATASSHYAQAVQLSLKYITAASDYLIDEGMGMDLLKDRLDIGKLGRGGIGV